MRFNNFNLPWNEGETSEQYIVRWGTDAATTPEGSSIHDYKQATKLAKALIGVWDFVSIETYQITYVRRLRVEFDTFK